MKLICKLVGHKMYNIVWSSKDQDFTVLCLRCEKRWEKRWESA